MARSTRTIPPSKSRICTTTGKDWLFVCDTRRIKKFVHSWLLQYRSCPLVANLLAHLPRSPLPLPGRSKGQLGSDNAGAEAGFREVLGLADGQGSGSALEEWGFKATKQLVKLACRTGRFGDMLTHYRSLLKRIAAGAATRNRSEKAINSILDLVSSSAEPTSAERSGPTASSSSSLSGAVSDGRGDGGSATTGGGSLLQDFYGTTLAALEGAAGNDRLCFKTRLKLARLHLAQRDWRALGSLLSALQESVAGPVAGSAGGSEGDDRSRATQALEVYALMIQMYTELRDMKRLAATYKVREPSRTPNLTGEHRTTGLADDHTSPNLRPPLLPPATPSRPAACRGSRAHGRASPRHHGGDPRVRREDPHAGPRLGRRAGRIRICLQSVRGGG